MPNKSKQATPPRSKKLTLKRIQSQDKKLNAMSTFIYDETENIKIKYYERFSESKIDELLEELNKSMIYTEENDLDYFKEERNFVMFIHFLIIKHFSELGNEIPEDFPAQFTIMKQFYDNGVYHKLLNEMFDQEEILRVIERVETMASIINKTLEQAQKELEKMDRIQNKDVFSQPFNVLASPTTDGMLQ